MKKKTLYIILSAALLVGGGILVWFFFFKKPKDLAAYVPKDAIVVIKLDIPGMGKKLDMKKIKQLKVYDNFKSNIEKGIASSGIALNQAPYAFFAKEGDGKDLDFYITGVIGISNRNNFIKSLKSNLSLEDKEVKTEGSFKCINRKNNEGWFITSDVAFFITVMKGEKITPLSIAQRLIKLKSSESILENPEYTEFQKSQSDLSLYINKKGVRKFMDDNKDAMSLMDDMMPGATKMLNKIFNFFPNGMTLNFEEDAIKFRTAFDNVIQKNSIYKNNGMSASDLHYFAPDGKPLAYFSVNMNISKFMNIVMEILEMTDNEKLDAFKEKMADFTDKTGITESELFNSLAGNLSFSITGTEPRQYTYVNPYALDPSTAAPILKTKNVPLFVVHATLGNTKMYDLLLTKSIEKNEVVDDIISISSTRDANDKYFLTRKGNEILYSNKRSYIEDFKNGKSWPALDASCKQQIAVNNPMAIYWTLHNPDIMNLNEEVAPFMKSSVDDVMKEMDCMVGYMSVKDKEAVLEMKMSPKKENAIMRILEMIDDAASKFSGL